MSEGSSTTISMREANQGFAEMIRAVESGQEFVITRRGQAVARVVPVSRRRVLTPAQQAALERTRARMAHGALRSPPGSARAADPRAHGARV